jgi:L-asparagine oxygenase
MVTIYNLRSLATQDESKSYCLNFNHGVTHCLQPEGKALFEKIHQLLNENTFDILLEEGSALIIDNNKMLHGRNLFKPKFDGKDRWLQRVYVKKGEIKNG